MRINMSDKSALRIAYILNVFPKLSETFIINEIRALQQRDMEIDLYALFKAQGQEANLEVDDLLQNTRFLSALTVFKTLLNAHAYFFFHFPLRYLGVLRYCVVKQKVSYVRAFWQLFRAVLRGRKNASQDERQNPLLHFFLAVPFARVMIDERYDLLHAHFADAATTFALIISRMTRIPFSFTTHAVDLFVEQTLMAEKIDQAEFIITCTGYNGQYLREHYHAEPDKVHVLYHGLDLPKFTMTGKRKTSENPIVLLVGRLVKKKGGAVLLKSCSILKERGVKFQCWIAGDGPERAHLELQSTVNHLKDVMKFFGTVPNSQMRSFYEQAAVFVLPCIIDEKGDRDGIPNVMLEAMAMGLPVVSTNISAIPEVLQHRVNGYMLEPADYEGLADALQELLSNTRLRNALGKNGRSAVEQLFDLERNSEALALLFANQLQRIREKSLL